MEHTKEVRDAMKTWALGYEPVRRAGPQSTPEEVGAALKEMRDQELYKEAAEDFYVYCAKRFGLSPERVEGYIAAHEGCEPPPSQSEPEIESEIGIVYFIAGADLVKIGFTNDVHIRQRSIQSMSPVALHLIHTEPGDRALEAALHKQFAEYRSHGEWFRLEGAVKDYVGKMHS